LERNEYFAIFKLENDYWWYRGLHELIEHYLKLYSQTPTLRILDAGCGTGRLMEIMRPYGRVEGLDDSPDAIKLAKNRGLLAVSREDLHAWKPAEAAYDIITCIDVLYCLEDDESVMRRLCDALKKNGILVLNVPAHEFLRRHHDQIVHTKRRYTLHGLKQKLRQAGFGVKKATYRLPFLALVILLIKIIEWFVKPEAVDSDLKPLPKSVNGFMLIMHRLENFLIKSGISIPFGSSVFAIARKQ
jgi:SAM-dependent methyltransferase